MIDWHCSVEPQLFPSIANLVSKWDSTRVDIVMCPPHVIGACIGRFLVPKQAISFESSMPRSRAAIVI